MPLFYNEYYVYKHYNGVIRIWSNSLFMSHPPNYIGGINYKMNDDYLKLDFFLPENQKFPPEINENTNLLFDHVLKIKQEYNKNKIIVDLHNSLHAYNNFWKFYGFNPTNIKCDDNPYWLKFEKID